MPIYFATADIEPFMTKEWLEQQRALWKTRTGVTHTDDELIAGWYHTHEKLCGELQVVPLEEMENNKENRAPPTSSFASELVPRNAPNFLPSLNSVTPPQTFSNRNPSFSSSKPPLPR